MSEAVLMLALYAFSCGTLWAGMRYGAPVPLRWMQVASGLLSAAALTLMAADVIPPPLAVLVVALPMGVGLVLAAGWGKFAWEKWLRSMGEYDGTDTK